MVLARICGFGVIVESIETEEDVDFVTIGFPSGLVFLMIISGSVEVVI